MRRILNIFRRRKIDRSFDEELQSHIDEATASGRTSEEIRRAIGSPLRHREESRSIRIAPWLDSLTSDIVFGFRQLKKNRVTSAAAILSLALAIGACTGAFRLLDAVLFRPLPIAHPERLYVTAYQFVDYEGKPQESDSFSYPLYRRMRDSVATDAQVFAISRTARIDITYGSDQDMEKANLQYVSTAMFPAFELKPAVGRLLDPSDDLKPGQHPYAVLSQNYWTSRFGRDPQVIGKTFRFGLNQFEIVGVLEGSFTGTEPGMVTGIFIPTMMNAEAIDQPNWGWIRILAHVNPGISSRVVRERLQAVFSTYQRERVKDWPADTPPARLEEFINSPLRLHAASTGVSITQRDYRRPLLVLAVVVGFVLLIACTNVANLMMAQAASRAREMALRISIGAGRWRLIQLVLVESALIAILASVLGAFFAWWSAPFVVEMLSKPGDSVQLVMGADWRVFGFGLALATAVTFLFGIFPALRASGVKPNAALKGGEDPQRGRRWMNSLIAVQVAFCVLVHFAAGLFVSTLQKLTDQPTGFSAGRLLVLQTSSKNREQTAERWREVAEELRSVPGVEEVAMSDWALMYGNSWTASIRVPGKASEAIAPYVLNVSQGFLKTMRIPLVDGRDFRPEDPRPRVDADKHPQSGVVIVNEEFARQYFNGENPVGRSFELRQENIGTRAQIVGYMRDSRYRDLRERIRPTVYLPMPPRRWQSFIVRTASDPLALGPSLRREVSRIRPDLRVTDVTTQTALVDQWTIRERLLAALSLFFAGVALILAAVGLYGVLHYSVLQRRREIGIRMALGAQAMDVVRRVSAEVFAMLFIGSVAGLAAGMASERFLETLLFGVKTTDWQILAIPAATLTIAAILAALPPVLRAVRIDPAQALRSE